MQTIYLISGVPGSGKSWVCNQLKDKFHYVPHDDYLQQSYPSYLVEEALVSNRPILADCPFAERALKDALEIEGVTVVAIFIVETPEVIKERYESARDRLIPKAHLTRAVSIKDRALEWNAFSGTSSEVLKHLQNI